MNEKQTKMENVCTDGAIRIEILLHHTLFVLKTQFGNNWLQDFNSTQMLDSYDDVRQSRRTVLQTRGGREENCKMMHPR